MVLYGFVIENEVVKLNAYILEENNGWEAVFEMPESIFKSKILDKFEDWNQEIKLSQDVFFPDYFPDPPMFEAGGMAWKFDKSILEEDEEFGDEMIYFFHYA